MHRVRRSPDATHSGKAARALQRDHPAHVCLQAVRCFTEDGTEPRGWRVEQHVRLTVLDYRPVSKHRQPAEEVEEGERGVRNGDERRVGKALMQHAVESRRVGSGRGCRRFIEKHES